MGDGLEEGSDDGGMGGLRKRKRLRGSGGGAGGAVPGASGPRAELNFRIGEVVQGLREYQLRHCKNVFYGPVTVNVAPDYFEIVAMEDHMYIQKMEQKVGGWGWGFRQGC
jgi:hypothetical protein